MAALVFGDGTDAVRAIPINQEWGMRRIKDLIPIGEVLVKINELLLCCWMQVQAWLVEEQDRVLVALLGFNQENEVEREEPLKAFAAGLQFNLNIRPPVVGDPNTKVIAIG